MLSSDAWRGQVGKDGQCALFGCAVVQDAKSKWAKYYIVDIGYRVQNRHWSTHWTRECDFKLFILLVGYAWNEAFAFWNLKILGVNTLGSLMWGRGTGGTPIPTLCPGARGPRDTTVFICWNFKICQPCTCFPLAILNKFVIVKYRDLGV